MGFLSNTQKYVCSMALTRTPDRQQHMELFVRQTLLGACCRGAVRLAGALLVTTALMLPAIYRSDLEGIALRAIAGWSLWLGFSVWRLSKKMSAKA
jgi:hypothetical protein